MLLCWSRGKYQVEVQKSACDRKKIPYVVLVLIFKYRNLWGKNMKASNEHCFLSVRCIAVFWAFEVFFINLRSYN